MFIDKEVINKAKQIDLLTYLLNNEPNELVKINDRNYTTREHDSLIISNGLWNWFSKGIGGKSAIDYLIKVKGMSFQNAVERVTGIDNRKIVNTYQYDNKQEYNLKLPAKNNSNNRVIHYLKNRGIHTDIIEYCIKNKLLYEDTPYHNAVFIGYDKYNNARYACIRSTGNKRYVFEAKGSDKHYSFVLNSNDKSNNEVHLFEGAIDVLSYATILKHNNQEWNKVNMLSLAGVSQSPKIPANNKMPVALERYLIDKPNTKTIVLHLDRDIVGLNATETLKAIIPMKYTVIVEQISVGKDVNEQLCSILKADKDNSKER